MVTDAVAPINTSNRGWTILKYALAAATPGLGFLAVLAVLFNAILIGGLVSEPGGPSRTTIFMFNAMPLLLFFEIWWLVGWRSIQRLRRALKDPESDENWRALRWLSLIPLSAFERISWDIPDDNVLRVIFEVIEGEKPHYSARQQLDIALRLNRTISGRLFNPETIRALRQAGILNEDFEPTPPL